MKRLISVFLVCALVLFGCAQERETTTANYNTSQLEVQDEKVSDFGDETTNAKKDDTNQRNEEIPIAEGEDVDSSSYKYQVEFDSLDDKNLIRYVRDNIYAELVDELDSDKFFVENVSATYVSQEYIDELIFNSQPNIYFGYTLAELDEVFQGTRYIFTLGDEGDTIVTEFEGYDETYDKVIKNVAIGTGAVLVCVTVSVVTGGAGAPAVSMIFAVSAKTGTIFALSSGALSSVVAGVVTGIQTRDMEQAKKAAALAGSESFKWGAITGVVSGGISETIALKGATMKGLTINEAAAIQKESKYPVEVIKQFHTVEEYEIFKTANLQPCMINGKTALVRTDFNLDFIDELGRTNLQRMKLGLSPLDANGFSYELHHIGQETDATLAILTQAEHDDIVLHGFKTISEIDRNAFTKQRKNFWKTMSTLFEAGGLI